MTFCLSSTQETIDANINKARRGLRSKRSPKNHQQTERIEHVFSTYYSKRLSMSKHEHREFQICQSPSASSVTSSRTRDRQLEEEFSHNTPKRISQCCSSASKSSQITAALPKALSENEDSSSNDYHLARNYMANTESSKAKARSHSEPKQRPKWSMKPKSRRTASMERMNDTETIQMQHPTSIVRHSHEIQFPWLVKLYRSAKSIKDREHDSTSITTKNSTYCKTIIAYEVSI
ncbi:unnamed protein product [Ilex paraguariensis]|uniref:DUF4005 domain-containing protein n=1 Tax=Ilex paraguariensis TaxID=185542 RepID=A0ABC8R8T8_9AQUA